MGMMGKAAFTMLASPLSQHDHGTKTNVTSTTLAADNQSLRVQFPPGTVLLHELESLVEVSDIVRTLGLRGQPVVHTDRATSVSVNHTGPALSVQQALRCVYDDLDVVRVGNHHLLRHAAGQDFLVVRNLGQLPKGQFHVSS